MPYPQTSTILDFTVVNSHNPLTLGLMDVSFYTDGFIIQNPTYEITPPSFPKATVIFPPTQLIFLNSNNLNITCVSEIVHLTPLPDGIWTVRQTVAPPITYNKEKTFIRTTIIEQKFANALLKTDLTECNQDLKTEHMKVLNQVWFYIQASISAANQCNNNLAMKLYRNADDMLDNFINGRCLKTPNTMIY